MKNFIIKLRKTAFLIFFLLCIAVVLTVVTTAENKTPELFGYSIMNVSSVSMKPNYKLGDIIITKKVDAETLNVNDVISFYSVDPNIYGVPNTHRIVKVIKENNDIKFQTKGDNNQFEDNFLVDDENIIGEVVFKIPHVGKAISFLNNRIVFFLCLILPMIILVILEVRNIIKISRDKDEADE